MRKSSVTLLLIWLLLFSGCARPRTLIRQPVVKSSYHAVKPKALAKSIRSVYKTSGGYEMESAEEQDFSYQSAESSLAELRLQCRKLRKKGLQIVALDCLQQALRRNPSPDPTLDIEMSQIWLELGNAQAALPFIQSAHSALPDSPMPLFLLGMALSDLGNLQAARDAFLRSLRRDPQQPVALLRLGEVLLESGDAPGAIETLKKALALARQLPRVHELLAEAYLETGNEPEAIQVLSHLYGRADAFEKVGEYYFAHGDWQSSRRSFEELDRLAPGHPAARARLSLLDSLLPRPTVVHIGPFGRTTPIKLAGTHIEVSPHKENLRRRRFTVPPGSEDSRRLRMIEAMPAMDRVESTRKVGGELIVVGESAESVQLENRDHGADDSKISKVEIRSLPAPRELPATLRLKPIDAPPADWFSILRNTLLADASVYSLQRVEASPGLEGKAVASQKETFPLDLSAGSFKNLFFTNPVDTSLSKSRAARPVVSEKALDENPGRVSK